jgi:beta-lactamase superfamily II metal-dependent hydrolase
MPFYDPNGDFGFEVDFLPVGDANKSGDAICLRWGYDLENRYGRKRQYVCVVDGGFVVTGDAIVSHLKKYYGTTHVNVVVNTHPHRDHVGGLQKVIEQCTVDYLVMHRPWEHSGLAHYFDDGRVTNRGIRNSLRENLTPVIQLTQLAKSKGIKLCECFAPSKWDNLCGVNVFVLGPSQEYYHSLLPNFSSTPTEPDYCGERVEYEDHEIPEQYSPLTNDGVTSAENNSSIILAFELPKRKIVLLTGDAGIPALEYAAREAEKQSIDLKNQVAFFQMPHHGSIQNLGPFILDKILGTPTEAFARQKTGAYASVCKCPEVGHPAKHVTNAIQTRNCDCFSTRGHTIHKSFGRVPNRSGWTSLTPIPYYPNVEALA